MNPTRTTPPCYNNTTLGNCLCAWRKGPNVTNPICWTCKNCSYKCAPDCEHCHKIQHTAALIIFHLNLQTITIIRMLSSGGEGAVKHTSITQSVCSATDTHSRFWRHKTPQPDCMTHNPENQHQISDTRFLNVCPWHRF